ncbi:MAG: hypothetical protein FWC56_03155 [Phycisphaerae bacterium]|nr:hypothetical protein [Phycisphaerae bacterium]
MARKSLRGKGMIVSAFIGMALLGGCRLEDGAAIGLQNGAATAVASLITTPVGVWLNGIFGK